MAVADALANDDEAIAALAGEVGEAIFSGPLRDKIRITLVALLTKRLEQHGRVLSALDKVRTELTADWRITQGGPDGEPTPTRDLVELARVLLAEVKHGEDYLQRTVQLAIMEARSLPPETNLPGGLGDKFSGEAERIPVPSDLSAEHRETARNLAERLARAFQASKPVHATVESAEKSSNSPTASADISDTEENTSATD